MFAVTPFLFSPYIKPKWQWRITFQVFPTFSTALFRNRVAVSAAENVGRKGGGVETRERSDQLSYGNFFAPTLCLDIPFYSFLLMLHAKNLREG
jgi:hypothetical protein